MFSAVSRFLVTTTVICTGGAGLLGAGGAAVGDPRGGVEQARAGGGWGAPITVGISPQTPPTFDVAVARAGEMTVAYVEDGDVLLVHRPAGGDWGPPTTLVGNGTANEVQAAYDGAGRLMVAWADARARTRLVSRYQLDGGGWSPAEIVASRRSGRFEGLDLEVNQRGDAALAADCALVSHRRVGGAWSKPSRFVAERCDLALGGAGPVALAWTTWDGDAATVRVARRPLGGDWGKARVLAEFSGFLLAPGSTTVAVDGAGTTTVAWRDQGPHGAWQVRASRALRGEPFGPEVVLGARAGNSDLVYSPPRVLTNHRGVTLVLWMRTNGTLWAARRVVGGPWSAPVKVKSQPGFWQWDAALDSTGRAVAVWTRGGWFGERGQGVVASLMTKRGRWSVPVNITRRSEQVYNPTVAMNHRDALSGWTRVLDVGDYRYRASTHLGS
jgi:hypothetical protein